MHVLQGERPMAAQNRTLGKFKLAGIPPAPRGVPQIEVTFDIDANGILNVTAKDNATGKDQKITITSSSGLSKEEVERMAKDAEAHAAEDKEQREEVEARNRLDSMVYNVEKMLKDAGDKVAGVGQDRGRDRAGGCEDDAGGNAERDGAECGQGASDDGEPQAGRGDVQGDCGWQALRPMARRLRLELPMSRRRMKA